LIAIFIILSYDVVEKRCNKVHRLCKKYFRPVHNSVFEGELSQNKLNEFKDKIKSIIDTSTDSIRIYELNSERYAFVEMLGKSVVRDNIIHS